MLELESQPGLYGFQAHIVFPTLCYLPLIPAMHGAGHCVGDLLVFAQNFTILEPNVIPILQIFLEDK